MTKADPKLVRALARLRLGIVFLQGALRSQNLTTIIRLRRYVSQAAESYRVAADSAPNDLFNSVAKVQGVAHLITAAKLCEETSQGLRAFMEVV